MYPLCITHRGNALTNLPMIFTMKMSLKEFSHYQIFSLPCIHHIGCDMKRCIVAEDRVIWLKLRPFRSNLSHYTIKISHSALSCNWTLYLRNFEHVQNVTMHCDSLWFFRMVTDEIAERLALQDIVRCNALEAWKPCNVRPSLNCNLNAWNIRDS